MLVTHMTNQRESENTNQKSDFDLEKRNSSNFGFEDIQSNRFWTDTFTTFQISLKGLLSKNHVLVILHRENDIFCPFWSFIKNIIM